jgi:spermidine synthase
VVAAARNHLGFKPSGESRVHVQDALTFLDEATGDGEKSNIGQFDLIFVDAFLKESGVPRHLTSAHFVERVHALLAPGGVVAVNVQFKDGKQDEFALYQFDLYLRHFANVYSLTPINSKNGRTPTTHLSLPLKPTFLRITTFRARP